MNNSIKAKHIVDQAISALQQLASQSLMDNDFSTVTEISRLAEALQSLTNETPPNSSNPRTVEMLSKPKTEKQKSRGRTPTGTYPKFQKDGEKLVKIGWSKKSRTEYEHKAPKSAISTLISTIGALYSVEKYFKAQDVFPLKSTNGEEIPDYQGYLALKWLHSVGLIKKKGRDQYSLISNKDYEKEILAAWNNLKQFEN